MMPNEGMNVIKAKKIVMLKQTALVNWQEVQLTYTTVKAAQIIIVVLIKIITVSII